LILLAKRNYQGALSSTNQWWSAHWGDYFTGTYTSPQLLSADPQLPQGVYDAPADTVYCGNVPLDDLNAHYCPAGDYVAFDVDILNWSLTLGDAFIYLVVAHEWGHAIQARLDPSLVQVRYELQADCFAGAEIQGAVNDGLVVLEPGDDQELYNSLVAVADASPWTNVNDHGNADERIAAYSNGANGGVNACLPTS